MIGKNKVGNIAIYLRLSNDDNDRDESESIVNQRNLINKYVKENFIFDEILEYVDDGYSGSNFNRPSFKKMIKDIDNRNIDVIITKNLARFARNYIDAGEYIEKIFPNKNVRYIAILDGVDTFQEKMENDLVPFKGLFNEMYCRETSKNIKATKRRKIQDGEFISSIVPYGYKKDPNNPKEYIIDENAARVIRKIFEMKSEGYTSKKIAEYLNEKNIPTPSQYMNIFKKREIKIWTGDGVSRLLSKPVYIGNSYYGKSQKISYKTKKKIYKNRHNCICKERHHPAIITKELFEAVHDNNKYNNQNRRAADVNSKIGDLIYCGVCGRKMGKRNRKGVISLHCSANRSSDEICNNTSTYKYNDIEKYIITQLNQDFQDFINKNKARISKKRLLEIEEKNNENLKKLELENKKNEKEISKLYSYRLNYKIEEQEYLIRYKELIKKRTYIIEEKEKIEGLIKENEDNVSLKNNLRKINRKLDKIKNETFSNEDILFFIREIKLKDKDIIIKYKFKE